MFKDFQTHKSKMSQEEGEEGEEGNEVHLGLPCGRQKQWQINCSILFDLFSCMTSREYLFQLVCKHECVLDEYGGIKKQ